MTLVGQRDSVDVSSVPRNRERTLRPSARVALTIATAAGSEDADMGADMAGEDGGMQVEAIPAEVVR